MKGSATNPPRSLPADAPAARSARNDRWARAVRPASLFLLAAATLAAFAGVLRNGWIGLDDPDYLVANPRINRGLTLQGLRWILHAPHGGNFHPLTSVVHMLDAQVFGLHPAGHHAVSLVLHALNAVLLVLALSRLTGAWWKSLLVGALFALHPLRVESVAWASELKDVLSGLFFFLTLRTYAHWSERPGAGRYALVLACLVLGLASKPMLVTLPCVLVLLDVWPLGRLRGFPRPRADANRRSAAPVRGLGGLIAEKWLMFALVAVFSAITFMVQRASGAVVAATNLPFVTRVLNAAFSYWQYLGLTIWPRGLVPFHLPDTGVLFAWGPVAALALAGVTALAIMQARRRAYLAVGWLWYVGTLVPVIGLVQVGRQAYADRYTYLTVVGASIAVVWALDELLPRGRWARTTTALVACVLLAASGVATARQVARWKDNYTLFTYTLSIDPSNPMAHHCLGTELLGRGRTRDAIRQFEAVLATHPDFGETRANLGIALNALGRRDEAIAQFREAIRVHDGVLVRHNLGLALMRSGRPDDAIAEYQAALRFDPEHYASLVELGAALGSEGRLAQAEDALRRAVELRPAEARIRRLLAMTLARQGRVEDAIEQYTILSRDDPNDLDALNNIAWIRATHPDPRHRNGAEAVRLAERAVAGSKEPVAVLYSTLAAAYAEAGRFPDAIRAGDRAVGLARAERDSGAVARDAAQLADYRAGRPFHFAR